VFLNNHNQQNKAFNKNHQALATSNDDNQNSNKTIINNTNNNNQNFKNNNFKQRDLKCTTCQIGGIEPKTVELAYSL
jgi:hypothetical protein